MTVSLTEHLPLPVSAAAILTRSRWALTAVTSEATVHLTSQMVRENDKRPIKLHSEEKVRNISGNEMIIIVK